MNHSHFDFRLGGHGMATSKNTASGNIGVYVRTGTSTGWRGTTWECAAAARPAATPPPTPTTPSASSSSSPLGMATFSKIQIDQSKKKNCGSSEHIKHRGRTYIESDRMMSSAPMESADQTAWAGGRASTTMVVLTRPPPRAV